MSQHTADATQPKHIAILPATPTALFADNQDHLILVFAGDLGLGTLRNGQIETLVAGPLTSAAPAPQGGVYFTQNDQILHSDLKGTNADLTARFGSPPRGQGHITLTPDRSLWLEGADKKLEADGTLQPFPVHADLTPIPLTRDIYDNAWTLVTTTEGNTQVLVLSADAQQQWQVVALNADDKTTQWEFIFADQVGFIWIGGSAGLRRFSPRQADAGWQHLSDTAVTALGPSPDDLALVAYATGELVEIDVDAQGKPRTTPLPKAPQAVRRTYVDRDGGIWAATSADLFYYPPSPQAWQQHWRALGRLPGGNHDIFSVVLEDKLYTVGGLTADWGFPPQTHVFDELFAYESAYDRWTVVSRMPFPRCYNGLAVFDGNIWVVGGSANLREPDDPDGERLPLDAVHYYDIKSASWVQAPSLNIARNEPTVLATAGRLYCIGGTSPSGAETSVESLAPGEDAWRFEAPISAPFNQAAGCVLGGLLYCINREGFFAYDPQTGAWDADLPQLPQSPQAALVGVYKNEIWVMGGSRLRTSHRYNPAHRQWLAAPSLPTDQSWGAAHTLGERLIIAGGAHWDEFHQAYIYEDRVFALRQDVALPAEPAE